MLGHALRGYDGQGLDVVPGTPPPSCGSFICVTLFTVKLASAQLVSDCVCESMYGVSYREGCVRLFGRE